MKGIPILRGFVEVDEGQIHYRKCGDENAPVLVMLHGSPLSSFSIIPLMKELARYFYVIAPDTLGNGDSSPQKKFPVSIKYLADAMIRGMANFGLTKFFVYGFHTGGNIGIEAALSNPDIVKKLIIDGMGLYSDEDRKNLLANQAPEIKTDLEGTQFLKAWHLVRDGKLFWPWWNRKAEGRREVGLPDSDFLHDEVLELLKSIRSYHHNYRAALGYDKVTRVPLLNLPVLVMASENDMLRSYLEEASRLIPSSEYAVGGDPNSIEGLQKTAQICKNFLID